jgi:CheY-like chemotaxis protein
MILDLVLPDMNGCELLNKMVSELGIRDLPVVIYTMKDLTRKEEMELRRYANSIIIKGAESHPRLLDETAMFLHRVEKGLPEEKQRMIRQVHDSDSLFARKKILIVDDDVRNVFALTSVLEGHGAMVAFAENGRQALDVLHTEPDFDLIIMDIMMPEMDGYETVSRIRKNEKYRDLPIIALTAKAMKGDREKCIQSGASDYISKPVDSNQLLSLLRVWLV